MKVEPSFRIAHEEIVILSLRDHKELEPRLNGSNRKFQVNFATKENGKFVAP